VGKHKIAFAAASLTLQIKYIVHLFRFVSFFLGLHIYFHRILVSVHIFLVQCLSQVHIHWMSSTQTTRRHKSALQYGKNTPYMAIFSTILFRLTGISGVGVFRFFGATPPQKLTKTFSKILQRFRNKIRENTSQDLYFILILIKMEWNTYSFKAKLFNGKLNKN